LCAGAAGAQRPRTFKLFCFPTALTARLVRELPAAVRLDPHDEAYDSVLYVVALGGAFFWGTAPRAAHLTAHAGWRIDKGQEPPPPGHWLHPYAPQGLHVLPAGEPEEASAAKSAAALCAASPTRAPTFSGAGVASRAFFKLYEAFHVVPSIQRWLDRQAAAAGAAGGRAALAAVDLGASPGGWAQFLALRGDMACVAAVDPGDLDSRVLAMEQIAHLRMKSQDCVPALRSALRAKAGGGARPVQLHVAVCDMNTHHEVSCGCVLDVEPLLAPGAPIVLTVKLVEKFRPVRLVMAEVRAALAPKFERFEPVWLFANGRFERTMVAWKKQ